MNLVVTYKVPPLDAAEQGDLNQLMEDGDFNGLLEFIEWKSCRPVGIEKRDR